MPEQVVAGGGGQRWRHPESLFDLSLESCSTLLSNVAAKLYMEYEYFEDEGCQEAIRTVQDALIHMLPLRLFETLAKHRGCRSKSLLADDGLRLGRITVAIFLHHRLTRVKVQSREMKLGMIKEHGSPEGDPFWISHLRNLTNLASLDLGQLATDEMLEVIGQSCFKLQTIKFEPRIKVGDNGVFLKSCVTEQGVLTLLSCRLLRKVTVGQGLAEGFGLGRRFDPILTRKFILGLPLLEDINYQFMGTILHGGNPEYKRTYRKPTRLKIFRQCDPTDVSVSDIELECPDLHHLTLDVDRTARAQTTAHQPEENAQKCSSIVMALAESESINLRTLYVGHYPFCDAMKKFVQIKGSNLVNLEIKNYRETNWPLDHPMDSSHVELIGQHCPNLRILSIRHLKPAATGGPVLNLAQIRQRQYFKNLRTLNIWGDDWNTDHLIPTLLLCATQIQEVYLTRITFCPRRVSIDRPLSTVLGHNPMTDLTTFQNCGRLCMSFQVLQRLTDQCTSLREIQVKEHVDETEQFKDLVDSLRRQNVHIDNESHGAIFCWKERLE